MRLLAWLLASVWSTAAVAASATVAVASNFAEPARILAAQFERACDHRLKLTLGSTGKLYAQILHGAPFDLFLAADDARPRLLEDAGRAVAGSRRTYAIGELVLLQGPKARGVMSSRERLLNGQFTRLAMANPELAPYGLAALDTLRSLGIDRSVAGKLVFGDNVGQAYAMLHTGNVDLAFVAAAQVIAEGVAADRFWRVPETLHLPIRQQLVLLERGAANPAALAFLDFLATPAAQNLIVGLGYRPLTDRSAN